MNRGDVVLAYYPFATGSGGKRRPGIVVHKASYVALPGFGWMRVYSRLVGCVQMLYAAIVGWLAVGELRSLAYDIGHYGESIGKGGGLISPSPGDLLALAVFSLLSLTSFIGGYGLLRLRPWARRWEIAYLGAVLAAVAVSMGAMLSGAIRMPRGFDDLTLLALIATVFALPYLPFVVTTWSDVVSSSRCESPSKPVVDDPDER